MIETNYFFTKTLKIRQILEDDLHLISTWSDDQGAYGEFLTREFFSYEECQSKCMTGYFWNDKSEEYFPTKMFKKIGL